MRVPLMAVSKLFFFVLFGFFWSRLSFADSVTDLAKASQNPVEKLVSVPFNNNFNHGYGPNRQTQYILDVKPVVPFTLNADWNLIVRTIVPLIHQPNLLPARPYLTGLGDLNPTLFLTPAKPGPLIWGVGPALVLPTATHSQLGQGKYSAGPSFVVLTMPGQWVVGFLMSNVWSFGGQSNRPNVNQYSLQYFINYNFSHGWFVTTQPIVTADWQADSANRWTVPLGAGVGRVFEVGKQPLNVSLQAYDNVKTPRQFGPNWQCQLNVTLLFPEASAK